MAGLWRAFRTRPVFASLFVWPTKWPQYILVILPAVSVCAGMGVETIAGGAVRLWKQRSPSAA